jgi:hypothetical protein
MGVRGRGLRALRRAAAVFAGDFFLPPLRPRATACGFFRGMCQGV